MVLHLSHRNAESLPLAFPGPRSYQILFLPKYKDRDALPALPLIQVAAKEVPEFSTGLLAPRPPVEPLGAQGRGLYSLLYGMLAGTAGFLQTGRNGSLPWVRWRENKQMLKINDCSERELNGHQPRMAAFEN